ncbi:glycosyltransferase family 4 protein [Thiocapsa bogorovii]|uniref:glycosyltransferase family 4 protein n=1 Tax=Thiocapsa bogorovii TaxID=521689 RepID=UPI001E32CED0|nr:glycosyltransferase family 4 protein [Thiocapsa bogorovii]UHD16883.1 glycosyltransferase family 4 protein [Thiocapsa bogorovii]
MTNKTPPSPAIWFPAVRTGTGTDVFTIRLGEALNRRGIRSEIAWLPRRAEYMPLTVKSPKPPTWANITHVNSWLHPRFLTKTLPLVVTVHHSVHDLALTPYKNLPRRLYHRIWVMACETSSIAKANAVTTVSQYTANQVVRTFGRSDTVVIHNWIDLEHFAPDQRQTPHHPFRLLFIGTVSRRKGADLLPEIMRRLGGDFELLYNAKPADFGAGANLPINMIGLGRLDGDKALIDAYRNCDALLFPTRIEGFGLVALEAQACQRPVIATDGSALPEVVEQGRTGILCPIDDVGAFVAAARRLCEQITDWQQMSEAARERAVLNFGEERAIDAYISMYRRLIQTA